jgi:hypothetical protein
LETSGDDAGDYFDDGPDDYDDDVEYATVDAVNGGAAAIEGMEADLPDFGAAMPEAAAAAMTFEDLVRKHIESYIAETQQCVAHARNPSTPSTTTPTTSTLFSFSGATYHDQTLQCPMY